MTERWVILRVHLEIIVIFPLDLLHPLAGFHWLDQQVNSPFALWPQRELHRLNLDQAGALINFLKLKSRLDARVVDNRQLLAQKLVRVVHISFVNLTHVDFSPRNLTINLLNLQNHWNLCQSSIHCLKKKLIPIPGCSTSYCTP